jgi:hypothetical protein
MEENNRTEMDPSITPAPIIPAGRKKNRGELRLSTRKSSGLSGFRNTVVVDPILYRIKSSFAASIDLLLAGTE